MTPLLAALLAFASMVPSLRVEDPAYVLKTDMADLPTELKDGIRKELGRQRFRVFDKKGELHCEFWLRARLPVSATPEQIMNGLTFKELEQSTLLGAIRFAKPVTDYRKQELAAGVYTLRLALQPQDGDHMGTAPHPEFMAVIAAASDESPAPLDVKKMHEKSAEAVGGNHPGVFLVFPNPKPDAAPRLVQEQPDHWAVRHFLNVEADGKTGKVGISLCVVGHSSAGAILR